MISRMDVRLRRAMIQMFESGIKRRPVFRYWRELEQSQWQDQEHLAELQLQRLKALVAHATSTTEWYGKTYAELGIDASRLNDIVDLDALPLIDRGTISNNRRRMLTDTPGIRLIQKATGGSSGVPLRFDLDHDSNERRMAAWHRGYGWAGAEPGTRQWYLWGVPPDATKFWKKSKGRFYDKLYRRTTESCFELSASSVHHFSDSLARVRPDSIVAYTGALYEFASLLEQQGIQPYSPQSIVVGAEQLHSFQRNTIERVFGAPVFETYGSREFMLIGAECSYHSGLHLTSENLIVEVVDECGKAADPGVEGDVVVTDLTNMGLPFIRYRNGDRAVAGLGQCPCGRGLPTLPRVSGRILDVLTTPDGVRLPGEFFPHIMKEFPSVQRFQVIQEKTTSIEVHIVAPGWTEEDGDKLMREVAAVAGGALQIEIHRTNEIPLTNAGKLKVVVNRLSENSSNQTAVDLSK